MSDDSDVELEGEVYIIVVALGDGVGVKGCQTGVPPHGSAVILFCVI